MLNKDLDIKLTIGKDKKISTFHELLPFTIGKTSEMLVKFTYPYIVDWQLSEDEKNVNIESS